MNRLRRMEIFIALVEAGQVKLAAQTLNLSKSAVSHALTDLEHYLDIQLILRSNKSWQVTDTGLVYYEQCKKILADIEKMEDRARQDNQNLSGVIRISVPETFGSYTLAPVLAQFMNMHPKIVIKMNLTERFIDLVDERVDLAFRTGEIKDSSLVVSEIGQARMMLCASPDYLKKYGTPQSHKDLKNHKCLVYTRNPTWKLSKDGDRHDFTPNSHLIADSGETIREFSIRGQGISMLPTMLGEFAIKRGRLVEVLTDYDLAKMPVQAFWVGQNRAPMRVTRLLNFVVDELQSRPRDVAEFVQA